LKASEAEVKGSVRQDLADSEARTAALAEEYDASKTTLTEKEVTIASLVSQPESLQARIQTLESELQEPQAKRDTETE
jgi:chromosome segregation ATPase